MKRLQNEIACNECGKMFLQHGSKHVYCSQKCYRKHRRTLLRGGYAPQDMARPEVNPNPIAPWMRPHICLWFLEGMSVKQIASMTMRPQTQIRKVLADKKEMERAEEMLLFRKDNGFSYGVKELT